MKIGIITDIHNNIMALNAILKKFQEENCDGIICCGDIIGIGPHPEETVSAIMEIPNLLACVKGNHERYLSDMSENMSDEERKYHEWEHALLSEKSKKFIESLKYEEFLNVGEKRIYVVHYAIDKNNKYPQFVKKPSLSELDELFSYVDADIILYGHNHEKSIFIGDKYFINCGSLGCPSKDKNIARALILSLSESISFQEIRIEYDIQQVLADINKFNYPAKDTIKAIFYGVQHSL